MLEEEGYVVVAQAEDGEKAVELATAHRPDLVILDVKMPRLDGIAAAERIASARIAPVVILTAFSQRDLVERARDAGAMAYLVKPFDKADLVPAIEMALSRFTELRQLEAEVADLGDRLETRKQVDRAKGVLQQSLGLSEPEAFRWIQKTAMDLRLSMREVAEGVVQHGPAAAGGAGHRYLSCTTSSVSSGATTSAGSRSATLTCLISSRRRATPTSSRPPVALSALRCASGTKLPSAAPSAVRLPCTTTRTTTLAPTPHP